MKLRELISEYEEDNARLMERLSDDNLDCVRELDRKVQKTFTDILQFNASSIADNTLQVEFLLNILSPNTSRSPLERLICDKIVSASKAN